MRVGVQEPGPLGGRVVELGQAGAGQVALVPIPAGDDLGQLPPADPLADHRLRRRRQRSPELFAADDGSVPVRRSVAVLGMIAVAISTGRRG